MNMFLLPVGAEDCGLSCLSGDGCAEVCGYFFVKYIGAPIFVSKKKERMKKVILFLCLLCCVIPPAKGIRPDRTYVRLPEHLGLIYKTLDVCTQDGYRIRTWFFPAQEAPGADAGSDTPLAYRTLDEQKRPTILICNGDAGNMSYYQLFLAGQFTSRGYNVATFDWRGFGASDPFPMDPDYLCYTEMLEDYRAVIRQVSAQPEVLPGGIYLLGWSTGAYLSMIAAEGDPSVKGCILRGVPTSFEQVIPVLQQAVGKDSTQLLVPEDFPVGKMPLALADTFDKDILIVVGQNDERTPVWMAEDIFAALPDGIEKGLWVAPGAKHGGMEAPEVLYPEEFVRRTIRFVERSFQGE